MIQIDWESIGAALTVLSVVFTVISVLITKLLVMPSIYKATVQWNDEMKRWAEVAEKKYVHAALFEERRDSLDYLISRHFAEDEKRQESIEKRLDHLIDLFGKDRRNN